MLTLIKVHNNLMMNLHHYRSSNVNPIKQNISNEAFNSSFWNFYVFQGLVKLESRFHYSIYSAVSPCREILFCSAGKFDMIEIEKLNLNETS
jgi:hypothetical protein